MIDRRQNLDAAKFSTQREVLKSADRMVAHPPRLTMAKPVRRFIKWLSIAYGSAQFAATSTVQSHQKCPAALRNVDSSKLLLHLMDKMGVGAGRRGFLKAGMGNSMLNYHLAARRPRRIALAMQCWLEKSHKECMFSIVATIAIALIRDIYGLVPISTIYGTWFKRGAIGRISDA